MYNLLKCLSVSLVLIGITVGDAQAYVDPGSGSVIVTTILGFIAAIGYTFRKYFYQVRRKLFGSKTEPEPNDE